MGAKEETMSYTWRAKSAWIGIKDDATGECVGAVLRSGRVRQCGHFCFVDVQINGRKVMASGAEDRIYPFHTVKLSEIGGVLPRDAVECLGFAADGNTLAFLYEGRIREIVKKGAIAKRDGFLAATRDVEKSLWRDHWFSRVQ